MYKQTNEINYVLAPCGSLDHDIRYSEVPNRRADQNKRAGLEKRSHPARLFTK
jgi:hypothetical protein